MSKENDREWKPYLTLTSAISSTPESPGRRGGVDGDVARIVGNRLADANFNFQVNQINLQLLDANGNLIAAAAYNVARHHRTTLKEAGNEKGNLCAADRQDACPTTCVGIGRPPWAWADLRGVVHHHEPPSRSSVEVHLAHLAYTFNSWQVKSTSDFTGAWGWVWQEFSTDGAWGPLALEADLLFGPPVPAFLCGQLIVAASFAGAEVGLYTAMLGGAVGGDIYPPGPTGGAAIKVTAPLGDVAKLTSITGFGASLPEDGFTIYHVSGLKKTYATDPRPGGFAFTMEELSLTGLSLCCGITYDFTLYFTKAGFQYVEFVAKNLFPICCGISFDASVKFTVEGKEVTITPKRAGIVGCFTVYGDVQWQTPTTRIAGLEIYGFKLRCELAECNYVEFLTALCPEKIEEILDQDIFKGEEFEYVKLGFCGPGCCGGEYSAYIAIYFQPSGGLFGISRLGADMAIPIMRNFTFNVGFSVSTVVPPPSLDVGWTFSF